MRNLNPDEYAKYRHWMEVAKSNGIDRKAYYQRVKMLGWNYKDAATKKLNSPRDYDNGEFALYKGDNLISIGTVYEIAEETGKRLPYLHNLVFVGSTGRIGKNELVMIPLEGDEDEAM